MPTPDGSYARMRVPAPQQADTGSGFWIPRSEQEPSSSEGLSKDQIELSKKRVEDLNAMHKRNFEIMGMMAKVFVSQAVGFFLLAVMAFSLLAFLATDDPNHKVTCALSVVINLVAAVHYYAIVQFRRLEVDDKGWTHIAIEFAVDACRYSDWLVSARAPRTDRAHRPCSAARARVPRR